MKLPRSFKRGASLLAALALGATLTTGCGDQDEFIAIGNFQQAPVAANDTITALGNATLNQAVGNGVLVNDAVNGGAITAFDAASTQGGVVVLNADGSFSYTPPFGFTGTDTFTYTLTNGLGTSTGTVTLNVNNSGWFVDNSGANGNGSQATPFNNLASAIAAAGNGDTIFVFRGDGTNNNLAGAVNLPAGVNLVGEGAGLVLAQTIVAQGNAPTITGPVICGGNNTISGFLFDGGGANQDAIQANDVSNLTVINNTFRNSQFTHMDLGNLGGTVVITDNTLEPTDGDESFIDIINKDTSGTYTISNNSFTDDAANDPSEGVRFDLAGTGSATITMDGNTFVSDNAAANSFDDAIEIDAYDDGQIAIMLTNNTFTNVGGSAIDADANGNNAGLTGTVSGNSTTGSDDNGLEFDAFGGTVDVTVSNNMVINSGQGGIDMDADGSGGSMTAVVSGNTVTGTAGDHAFELETVANSTGTIALRNNTLTGSKTFSVNVFNQGTTCLDITGNTVDDDMTFNANAGAINVERLDAGTGGPLDVVNTFNAGVVNTVGTVTAQNAGFCAIP